MFVFLFTLFCLVLALVVWWAVRSSMAIEHLLASAWEVLAPLSDQRAHLGQTAKGVYKGRNVLIGAMFSGFKGEFLPLPDIRMELKDTMGYNTNRLPHYAKIEGRELVYIPKLTLNWGVFDKTFPKIFSKNYLIIALEKMLTTAEDVERGRTLKEFFL